MTKLRSIIILGGGTAGWMAANLIAKRWQRLQVNIRVIESPEIGIIGVGEGSTPQLKAYFDSIGVTEADWMSNCNATYKTGITFKNWSQIPGFDEYFHPFPANTDRDTAPAFVYHHYLRRLNVDVPVSPNEYFLPAYLAAQKRGPIPSDNFPFPVSYGYHFDAHLLGGFLRDRAKDLGVALVHDNIVDVQLADNGDISSLQGKSGDHYTADFFVDATGFKSLLLQQALGVEFDSYADNLFNDAAVVLGTDTHGVPSPQTVSTAMHNGWRWEIPLTNRVGNGYVYSTQFCDADNAELELRTALGALDSDVEVRHLKMKVGQVREHWHRNCLAVGLSQGFIEPLEATALHLVQETVQRFITSFEEANFELDKQPRFNSVIRARFEGIRDYIVCHYKLNSRTDSSYWRANRDNQNLSDSLQALLDVWQSGGDLSAEIERQNISQYYASLSWHCLLAGYGIFPHDRALIGNDPRAERFDMAAIRDFNRRCALNFPCHREQLLELT